MMDARAIVLITTSFPTKGDGSEAAGSFVSDLAESLAKHLPVRVVAPGNASTRETWTSGIDVFRYAAPERPLSTLKPWRPRDLLVLFGVLRSGINATRQAVCAGPTAHMLALWALPSGAWARSVSRAKGVPYSVWALGSDIWSLGRLPVVRSFLRTVIRGATRRYADGLRLGEDAARIGGMPFDFLPSTRRLGAQRTRPLASVPPYRFLFLGRWHPNKGVDLLLDALALLGDSDWSQVAEVHIAGGGPMESLVFERIHKLKADGRPVRLSGFLDRTQATAALEAADYLLLPSRIESIPVVFSDAMKMRLPVIAMPVGDLPELIVEQQTGCVASEVSAKAFAQAMIKSLAGAPSRLLGALSAMDARFDLDQTVVPEILRLVSASRQDSSNV